MLQDDWVGLGPSGGMVERLGHLVLTMGEGAACCAPRLCPWGNSTLRTLRLAAHPPFSEEEGDAGRSQTKSVPGGCEGLALLVMKWDCLVGGEDFEAELEWFGLGFFDDDGLVGGAVEAGGDFVGAGGGAEEEEEVGVALLEALDGGAGDLGHALEGFLHLHEGLEAGNAGECEGDAFAAGWEGRCRWRASRLVQGLGGGDSVGFGEGAPAGRP